MTEYKYPTNEGAIEVAKHLGIKPDEIFSDYQDWEYTYPKLEYLPKYLSIYKVDGLSNQAKRVLGCFIFQSLEDILATGCDDLSVREILDMLYDDISIHKDEFLYWSLRDDPYYDKNIDDAWFITPYVREYI